MGISLSKNDPKGVDKISNLPSSIIENILCLVPIKEAVRTSILSKDWRYNWTKITKLVFHQKVFDETTDEFFDAIHQVLSRHPGPIFEFSLSIWDNEKCDKIDLIITDLVRKHSHTVKKLTVRLRELPYCPYKLPLSISLLHHLTDLCVSGIFFRAPRFSGFGIGSLTSLYVKGETIKKESLQDFLSNCPLLKHVILEPYFDDRFNEDIMIIELFECLPVIELLSIDSDWLWFKRDRVPARLPTAFVHLKYLCIKKVLLFDETRSENLVFVIRSSPNLENIKIEKLEIQGLAARNGEMEFVKVILAKSPVLMKARIILSKCITKDEELQIERLLLGSPRVSPLAELIVERQAISMRAVGI
ncbi:F-box/FBD/LRR-repeat protein-like protein [Tanacetum coccineum]